MSANEIIEKILELNPEALIPTGPGPGRERMYDSALVGYAERCGSPVVACYDQEKCVAWLQQQNGWDYETAREFFDFNVLGAYVGDSTPIFLTDLR